MKIEIKEEIRKVLQKKVDKSEEFNNLQEYINYILDQIAAKLRAQEKSYSNSEEAEIKKRLASLGYF